MHVFLSFLTMQTHAQAWVCWSKYTTVTPLWATSTKLRSCKTTYTATGTRTVYIYYYSLWSTLTTYHPPCREHTYLQQLNTLSHYGTLKTYIVEELSDVGGNCKLKFEIAMLFSSTSMNVHSNNITSSTTKPEPMEGTNKILANRDSIVTSLILEMNID